jgi:hypothetical protein
MKQKQKPNAAEVATTPDSYDKQEAHNLVRNLGQDGPKLALNMVYNVSRILESCQVVEVL